MQSWPAVIFGLVVSLVVLIDCLVMSDRAFIDWQWLVASIALLTVSLWATYAKLRDGS